MISPPITPSGWPPGHKVGRYEIVRTIGEGGMGIVYLADEPGTERQVALKVLHSDIASNPTKRKRFVREGKFLNALTHPNIAGVYEVGEDNDRVFIAMEYVAGQTLTALLKVRGRLEVDRAMRIALDVADALGQAHELGIIHRDLKPDNIVICDGDKAKILDFGIAKVDETQQSVSDTTNTDLTTKGQLLGTPAYMSPEQAKGLIVDTRSDVFSLGIVMYETLAGKRPFEGETWQELIIAVNRDHPTPLHQLNPSIPTELSVIVERCLEKQPEGRFKSSSAVALALEQLVRKGERAKQAATAMASPPVAVPATPSAASSVPVPPATAGLMRRHPILVALLVVVLLSALTLGGMVLFIRAG